VKPEEAVHIGDDRRNDLWGARDAGCDAWLWGSDVYSFKEVSNYPFFLFCSTLFANLKLL
jgi:FMN phosphatase YigB (HAD superfamily)